MLIINTYNIISSMEQVASYASNLVQGMVALLRNCPQEVTHLRKELLIAVRHILATDLRNKFLPCIDHLFDENLLIGSGWTTRESVSSCQWPSTCLLKMNVHDDTIPVSIQMMSCKLLLNLVESIRVKSEQDTGARELLDGGVHTQVQSHSAVPDP
eukprot:Em0005g1141a